ncbi:collagen-like protein [Holophaga foetida]|uniref:collagen-like protein n=1 Tax=Holophaga foetida TaxID=35839 RepID=UPI0006966C51|nr:collagen-like protein [Holophaga foetida]
MRRSLLPSLAAVLVSQMPFVAMATEALPNPQIAYQGRLLEGTLPVTGNRTFVFAILDSGGAELWNSGDQVLSVTNGLYAVVLGGTGMTAIPTEVLAKPNLKLRVAIGGTTLTPDTDLVPALQARSAFELTGSFAGDLGGTQYKTTLQSLQGFPLDLTTANPTSGQSLVFNGTSWVPREVTGEQGATGPQGPVGPAGPTGDQGAQGIQGIQGATGAVGATGATGATGAVANFRNAWSSSTTYAAGDAVSEDGTSYVALTISTAIDPATDVSGSGGHWAVLASKGATGAQGVAGPTGPTGPTGAQGIQGPQGDTGAQGPAGVAGPQGNHGFYRCNRRDRGNRSHRRDRPDRAHGSSWYCRCGRHHFHRHRHDWSCWELGFGDQYWDYLRCGSQFHHPPGSHRGRGLSFWRAAGGGQKWECVG